MRRSFIAMMALGLILALYAPLALANAGGAITQEDPKKAEADAYKLWYDANQAKDYNKAMEYAKAYLEKFPNGQYASYLKDKWIPSMRPFMFNEAMKAGNINEMIRIGNEQLAADPNNIDYLYLLAATIIAKELYAKPPVTTHEKEAVDYALRAAKLIEAGQQPKSVPPDKWKKNEALAYFYGAVASVERRNKNNDKALEYYQKAAALEPANPTNYLICGQIHQERYQEAVKVYQAMPEEKKTADPPDAETKAALDKVNAAADAVIECWARFMAVSKNKPEWDATRNQVMTALKGLYEYRHPDSPDGLQKLIDQYSANPPAPPK
ncbi:MAG TPA: hypothetical protein VNO70_03595 [Blastocatellia bacterium]|nr:hypothetical protein [Blastocatellia bacterium]